MRGRVLSFLLQSLESKNKYSISSCIYTYPNVSCKDQIELKKAIVSSVVLWAKYINANGYRCSCGTKAQDTTKRTPFSLLGTQTLSFLNSSISRWFLNTFSDLSTTTRKKSRRTKSFFSPLRYSMQKDFNCLLDHSFSMCISSFFYLFSISCNVVQLSSCYLYIKRGGVNLQYFVS